MHSFGIARMFSVLDVSYADHSRRVGVVANAQHQTNQVGVSAQSAGVVDLKLVDAKDVRHTDCLSWNGYDIKTPTIPGLNGATSRF
jgi:hypothetical protein